MSEPSQCSAPWKHDALPLSIQLSVLEDCYVGCSSPSPLKEREWPPRCSKLCCLTSENGVTRWGSASIRSLISDQNWIKNREAAASRFTLPRLDWQNNQRMNEPILALLLFASLSFLDSFFPSRLLLRNKSFSTSLHVVFPFHVISQVSRYLDDSLQWSLSPETDIWTKTQTKF